MRYILCLGEKLYVDLESGRCGRTRYPSAEESVEKLTHGQLRILSCLVENRERVCETGMLEGLFDGSLGEEQTAGIKQQLQRIKNKFRKVDDSFDRRKAKEVFQAVPGVGYRFHIPEGGELVQVSAPTDALRRLDGKWLRRVRQFGEEEKAAVRNAFDRMDSSWDNTLHASMLDMCVRSADARRRLQEFSRFLFQEDGARGIVTIASVGAEGKTVLLAEFARMCVEEHPNWNVYDLNLAKLEPSREAMREMIDYIRREGIGKIHRTILLLDDPVLLEDQFAFFLEQILRLDQRWLYVVLTNRLFPLTLAFEQPWMRDRRSFLRLYLLDPRHHVRGENEKAMRDHPAIYVVGPDGKKEKVDPEELERAWREREEKRAKRELVVAPSLEMKKEALAGIARRVFAPWKDVQKILEDALKELPYGEKSYVDLHLMLMGRAGRAAETQRDRIMELCACRGHAAWDDWVRAVSILDEKCEGKWTISRFYPVMASMWLFEIPVTVEFLCRATGWENYGALGWILKEDVGNSIYVGERGLLAPDRDVLDAYFYLHPEISPDYCLQELFRNSWMDAGMLVNVMDRTYLHFMQNGEENIPFSVRMLPLAIITRQNQTYMEMLREKGIADLPELAVLWYSYEPEFYQGSLSGPVIAFSSAFERLVTEEPRRMICVQYWLRFLKTAVFYFADIPDFLRDYYIDQDEETREKMLAGLENSLANGQYFQEKLWVEQMQHYLQELQKENAGKGDNDGGNKNKTEAGHALLTGEESGEGSRKNVCMLKEEAGGTEGTLRKKRRLKELLDKQKMQKSVLDKIAAREKEFFDLLHAEAQGEDSGSREGESEREAEGKLLDLRIRLAEIVTAYREYRDAMEEAGDQGGVLFVTARWSMFCCRMGMYEETNEILLYALQCLPESVEGMYWIYLIQGKLAQTEGQAQDCPSPEEAEYNPYYDLEKAEHYYWKSYENYLRYGNQDDLEPFIIILQSLALLYHMLGQAEKEELIYRELETRIPSARIRSMVQEENILRKGQRF